MKLSLVQLCILAVLSSPEDPTAWARWKQAARNQRWYLENRDKALASSREWVLENRDRATVTRRKWVSENRNRMTAWRRKRYLENRDKEAAMCRTWSRANPEKVAALSRKWKLKNRGKINAYKKRRRQVDPEFKILEYLRARLWKALRGETKSARTLELLGCTVPELRAHLEPLFKPGMTWENYGPVWHVDHKRPCAAFNLSDPAQQRACFHWKNLQPLFAEENMSKGPRLKCDS